MFHNFYSLSLSGLVLHTHTCGNQASLIPVNKLHMQISNVWKCIFIPRLHCLSCVENLKETHSGSRNLLNVMKRSRNHCRRMLKDLNLFKTREREISHSHSGWGCVPLPPPPPPSSPGSYRAALMAAVVSHYEPIWLCSCSHQRAVSTQTTAALRLSAAVKTGRDPPQLRMTPAPPPPHTHTLLDVDAD